MDLMLLVTLATVAGTGQTHVPATQTFHIIISKFFAIHEEQRVAHPIYHFVEYSSSLFRELFLLGTTDYFSSSSSSSSYKTVI